MSLKSILSEFRIKAERRLLKEIVHDDFMFSLKLLDNLKNGALKILPLTIV